MIACGMCGHEFPPAEGEACRSGCPMAGRCGMVTCPSCGYEFPTESKVVRLLTNLLRRGGRPRPGATAPRESEGRAR